jgi:hypothetical protein
MRLVVGRGVDSEPVAAIVQAGPHTGIAAMSVRERIEDAKLLWDAGRKEGAFVQILVAVASTARKRHPKPPKGSKPVPEERRPRPGEYATDAKAFKAFILDEMDKITGGPKYGVALPFQGKDKVPLEEILYTHLRCHMVHEGATPPSITFTEHIIHEGKSRSILRLTDPLGFPEFWMWNMARAVAQAPENRDLFRDYPINAPQAGGNA